jgi:starch-binding outer membrane protein, SusD/RagB family
MIMSNIRRLQRLAMLAALVPFAACSDILSLDVEAPGRIADDDLNTLGAVPGLAAGMSYNLTQALDAVVHEASMASLDLGHGGSYDFGGVPIGIFMRDVEYWSGEYGQMARARWTAENGLLRMREILGDAFERNASVAKAYLYGGFANRLLGEMQCRITIDGGPDLPHTEAFNRADSLFSRAIAVGTAAGSGAASYVTAAYGGRASVRAWLGRWSEAVSDAAKVPTSFMLQSTFSQANTNYIYIETNNRREMSLYTVMWADHPDDPRVPWDIPLQANGQPFRGQDGATIWYHQLKYTSPYDDIPITHGAEMRVLQAEAALRAGDYPGAESYLNEARAKWDMDPLTLSTTPAEAWATLRYERYATLFLEGRKLWDWRRWDAEGPPMRDPESVGRDLCFPISSAEQLSNPNVTRGDGGQWGGCPTCG